MNQQKYIWISLVSISMSVWVTFAQAQQADPVLKCDSPAQLDENKNIHIPCAVYEGQVFEVTLEHKVGEDGTEQWELPIDNVKKGSCAERKSVCAAVDGSGNTYFEALDIDGTVHTGLLAISDTSSNTWKWQVLETAPKWDFSNLMTEQHSVIPDFSLLIGSDVHMGICGDFGQGEVIQQMKTVANANGNTVGLIFNGDIIATGTADQGLPLWKDLLQELNLPVYEGLGNHDYFNYARLMNCATEEFAEWGVDACTVRVLQYLESQITNIPQMKWIDPKSRAYAFLLNGYLFVQFLYYPSFEQNIQDSEYSTQDSILWGKKVLAANAVSLKAPVVVNVHDYFTYSHEIADIVSGEGGQYVVGVFAGHMHEVRGYVERVGDPNQVGNYDLKNIYGVKVPKAQSGAIPVWNSGSMTQLENYFTDCNTQTNTITRTTTRSFFEIKLGAKGYNLKLWEGDRVSASYVVEWTW